MPHEIERVMRAFGSQAWFIEPRKAEEIAAMLAFRHRNGVRAEPFRDEPASRPDPTVSHGRVMVFRLFGAMMPRAEAVEDISQAACLMTEFNGAFRTAAAKEPVDVPFVLDIDSPGGRVDLVPEAADLVWAERKRGRKIVAVADTTMCSAAYFIGSQASEVVATPSALVGSIGVYTMHEDLTALLEAAGVRVTIVREGPRKAEGNPFEPLSPEALAHLQDTVRDCYELFVTAVARGRGVKAEVVRADPEHAKAHFGGGRAYPARQAKALGMVDSIETLDQVIARLQRRPRGAFF